MKTQIVERIVKTLSGIPGVGKSRKAMQAIPNVELREMHKSGKNASCCGAGGGVRSTNREMAREAAAIRIHEAEETEATVLTTACPFCTFNLKRRGRAGWQ